MIYFFISEFVKEVSDLQMPHVAPIILPNVLNIIQQTEVCLYVRSSDGMSKTVPGDPKRNFTSYRVPQNKRQNSTGLCHSNRAKFFIVVL